ncbi:hypothetical protein BO70DRAFT_201754 [Aspergillus heteromorphus CBS 117.55]|uniref:Uncharacterized protein n=1 Tax=Aspergillus heteromorphus CBS 117.55 TaxID=1448321 RepID=A0A317WR32_9EURO|nr:uncharacterized protein BO70DRAFT_201754 [Aspergillus heteromorphus CBS 117.55]PWY87732.1 hypothetical protein BO70DRAFT_201754 [Aspergillus heteromorphus CBS 117.55]
MACISGSGALVSSVCFFFFFSLFFVFKYVNWRDGEGYTTKERSTHFHTSAVDYLVCTYFGPLVASPHTREHGRNPGPGQGLDPDPRKLLRARSRRILRPLAHSHLGVRECPSRPGPFKAQALTHWDGTGSDTTLTLTLTLTVLTVLTVTLTDWHLLTHLSTTHLILHPPTTNPEPQPSPSHPIPSLTCVTTPPS